MNKLFSIFKERFGRFGYLRLFFYPWTALLATPLRLAQTLWNCRVLVRGNWGDYSHFSVFAGVDYLCYWTIASNLREFGHSGYSPYIGLGNHPLRRFFQYSLVSLLPYWRASTIVLLAGMFGWLFAHLIWLNYAPASWVLLVIFLAFISTTFYVNTFALQNYNVLGWLFFPLGLFGIFTKNWIIAAAAWLLVSFGSFTVTVIAGVISVASAFMNLSLIPVIAFVPAGLKLLAQFYPLLITKDIKSSFLSVMRGIGLYSKGAQYRHTHTLKASLTALYFLLIYGQFFVVFYLVTGKLPLIFLAGLVIFLVNSSLILRFLDIQSTQMLMLSLATAQLFQFPDSRLLVSYWILISPLPLLIPFPFMKRVLDVVPALAPFSIKEVKKDMEEFLGQIKAGERVLIAFDNPGGRYQKLFDGYRDLLEPLRYVASAKKVHLMPDYWAVFESNYQGAPSFWGRDIETVSKNIKNWKADYILVYQDAQTILSPEWELAGFKVVNKLSWLDYEKELKGVKPYYGNTPDWWLLRKPCH